MERNIYCYEIFSLSVQNGYPNFELLKEDCLQRFELSEEVFVVVLVLHSGQNQNNNKNWYINRVIINFQYEKGTYFVRRLSTSMSISFALINSGRYRCSFGV